MSVRLVLCVADSVWRAAGHLAWVCCMPTAHSHRDLARARVCCMPTAHSHIAPAEMLLLLLLAVLSHSTAVVVSSGSAETAAGDVCRGCAAVADSQRTIGVMVRQ